MIDRETIFNYIAADSPQAAIRIDDRIESQVELLVAAAAIGRPGRVEGTRELIIQHTPYIAAYRIDLGTVVILRVLHGAQVWPDSIEP